MRTTTAKATTGRFGRITLVALALALVAAACGDDDDTSTSVRPPGSSGQTDVEAELQALLELEDEAYTNGNAELLREVFTPAGIVEITGTEDPDEQAAALAEEVDFAPAERQISFELTSQSEDKAVARIEEAVGLIQCERDVDFVHDGDRWWVESYGNCMLGEHLRGERPLRIEMTDGEILVDEERLQAADYDSLEFVNTGEEMHMTLIVSVPADFDLDAALAEFDGPPPAEAVPLLVHCCYQPGTTEHWTNDFTLEPGRYIFMDPIPGADGTPNVLDGMVLDITIG